MSDVRQQPAERVRQADVAARVLVKLVVVAVAIVVVFAIWRRLMPLVGQTIVAVFVAIALDTIVRWLQRHGLGRGRAILVTLVAAFTLLAVTALVLVAPIVAAAERLAEAAPDTVAAVRELDGWQWLVDNTAVDDSLLSWTADVAVAIPGAVVGLVAGVVGGIFGLVNMILMVVFLLTGGDGVLRLAVRAWPRLTRTGPWEVVLGAYSNVGRYLIGATAQALLAGTALVLVLLVLGVPNAVPLGFVMFLLDYVPLVGSTIGAIPAVAVALLSGGLSDALVVTAFIVVYQQVENAWLQPKIQGHVVQLPVIATFFSVMVGGQLFGVAGALLAVPVASVLAIVVRQWFALTGRDRVDVPRVFGDDGRLLAPAPQPVEGPEP